VSSKVDVVKQIALIVESSGAYGRGLLRGVARFIHSTREWSVHLPIRTISDEIPDKLALDDCDGVMLRTDNPHVIERVRRLRVPTVALYDSSDLSEFPTVTSDECAVAQMAFDHFLERGFKKIAYCGVHGARFSNQRELAFVSIVNQHGLQCKVYRACHPETRSLLISSLQGAAVCDETELGAWIRTLSKPVGILASNDIRGRQVLSACSRNGNIVPDEVAVLGVDNDEEQCELANPSLSSIIHATEKIGFEGASMLSRMLNGQRIEESVIKHPPIGIHSRHSTDGLAIEDRQVERALQFMRRQVGNGINVADVLNHVHMSRSTLERKFSTLLGRTPKEEIQRQQINHVCYLLGDTSLTMEAIAEMSGIHHPEYLYRLFKKRTGVTPGRYRKTLAQDK